MIQVFSNYFRVTNVLIFDEIVGHRLFFNTAVRLENSDEVCFSGLRDGWLTTVALDTELVKRLNLVSDNYPKLDNWNIEIEFKEVLSKLLIDSVHIIEIDLESMKGYSTKLFKHGQEKYHEINLEFGYEGIVND